MRTSSTTILFLRTTSPLAARGGLVGEVAAADEWAVTGSFRFAHRDPASLMGRERRAFRESWLGLESFAPALHVMVTPIDGSTLDVILRRLAAHLLDAWNFPSPELAVEAALEQIEMARSFASHPLGTVLALERELNEQGLIERARPVLAGDRHP